MKIQSFQALAFQLNFSEAYYFLDNRGKLFDKVLNFEGEKLIENNGHGLRVNSEEASYTLNHQSFSMKINTSDLNNISSKEEELFDHVKSLNNKFIGLTEKICNVLDINYLSRIACRFIVNYSEVNDKYLSTIFNSSQNILKKNINYLENRVSIKNEANLKCSYNGNNQILTIDFDKYINNKNFKIGEVSSKYKAIMRSFSNVFNAKNLFKEIA